MAGYVYPGAVTSTDLLDCHYPDVLARLCRPSDEFATFVDLYPDICQVSGSH